MSHSQKMNGHAGTLALGDVLANGGGDRPPGEDDWVRLVRDIAAGDQAALRELYVRTHDIAFTLIARIVGTPAAAEEIALDVYQDVWESAARYDAAREPVVAWIMNLARSRAEARRRAGR